MSNCLEFFRALVKVLPNKPCLAVVHSSLPYLRPPPQIEKWDFLFAIEKLVDEGFSFAFPTFTFSFCGNGWYHFRSSPSETGILGQWVLDLADARRTGHPIYSFAVIGSLADEVESCVNSTTFGDDSTFALFEKLNAQIVMLGCGWEFCTQFHRYEEEYKVPYRYYKTFRGKANFGDGERNIEAKMFVRDLVLNPQNNFNAAVGSLRDAGKIYSTSLWAGKVESVQCNELAAAARRILDENIWNFVCDAELQAYKASAISQADSELPIKIAVLGNSNLELLMRAIEKVFPKYVDNRRVELYTVPFGCLFQQIIDENSNLHSFNADFAFFVDRLEDLCMEAFVENSDVNILKNRAAQYFNGIRRYRAFHSGPVIVHKFAALNRSAFGFADAQSDRIEGYSRIVERLNSKLSEAITGLPEVFLFDLANAAILLSEGDAVDHRLWFLGKIPFSEAFSQHLAERYIGLILSALGRTARVIVTDLDQTLWGGILGEDGIEGLKVGGDFPGNAFKSFQKLLKTLSKRGIALAICSKNDEKHAIEALSAVSENVLEPADFVAMRINWQPKWQNVMEICNELSIGQANILFIDDNPVERENMRKKLPAVKILDLPPDPALYCKALLDSPLIEALVLTPEDFKRLDGYRARQAFRSEAAAVGDMGEFLASLNLRIAISDMNEVNAARIVQLIAKTNQFNTTTKRRSLGDLKRMIAEGWRVVAIGAEDRFTPFENIGVLIFKTNYPAPASLTIDTYLLSCRALGKGIEKGVLYWLIDYAKRRGMNRIIGEIYETDRNKPAREIYRDMGFTPGETSGEWILNLERYICQIPSWLSITAPEI